MATVNVRLKRLAEDAELPTYAHAGDAGMDLHAAETVELAPGQRALVACGFAMELPEGYAAFVLPRSGLSSKHGITVVNAPGLIDSGYRGEIKVALVNLDLSELYVVEKNDRIAQMVIMPVPLVELYEADNLSDTERGDGGFGSTGFGS